MHLIVKFLKDESAATAIEYGLIATGIALAIIPVITGLGTHLKTTFSSFPPRSSSERRRPRPSFAAREKLPIAGPLHVRRVQWGRLICSPWCWRWRC